VGGGATEGIGGDVARQLGYVDIAHELAARGAGAIPSVRQTLRQPAQPTD
ncbi:ankyrin repeat-containing protein, partial [Rhodanobacter sp. 115]